MIIIRLLGMFVFIFLSVLPVSEGGEKAAPAPGNFSELGSLAGLDSVAGLIVEELDSEVVKNGLSRDDVRAEIEVLLYKHGLLKLDIKLFDPLLHVQVGTYKIGSVFAFTVRLEFLQNMRFARPMPKSSLRLFVPEKVRVPTWSRIVIGAAPVSDLSAIRRALRELTTEFITDFKKANDKHK